MRLAIVLTLVACAPRPAVVAESQRHPPTVDESTDETPIVAPVAHDRDVQPARPVEPASGVRTWYEGDTLVLGVQHRFWCKTVHDGATEQDIVECWSTQQRCGDGCVARNSVACVIATSVLDATRLFRCFGSMQTCGEQWIMLSTNVDYRDVSKCAVSRRVE
jgi:hypothetical protein